jgi:hypothetical protein
MLTYADVCRASLTAYLRKPDTEEAESAPDDSIPACPPAAGASELRGQESEDASPASAGEGATAAPVAAVPPAAAPSASSVLV